MLPNRRALISGLISVLMGGAALCLPMAAHAGEWTIKSGTSAQDAGKCLTNITLFAEISEGLLEKETPEYGEMASAWLDYIAKGGEDFSNEAIKAMTASATHYDDLSDEEDPEGLMAALVSDMADCLDFLLT